MGLPHYHKQEYVPHPDRLVLEVLSREEELWLGHIELTLRDRRLVRAHWRAHNPRDFDLSLDPPAPDYNAMFRPSPSCYEVLDHTYSLTNLPNLPVETVEPHPEDLIFEEIENLGIHVGHLERKIKTKEALK